MAGIHDANDVEREQSAADHREHSFRVTIDH
jgi:hypothetical protein